MSSTQTRIGDVLTAGGVFVAFGMMSAPVTARALFEYPAEQRPIYGEFGNHYFGPIHGTAMMEEDHAAVSPTAVSHRIGAGAKNGKQDVELEQDGVAWLDAAMGRINELASLDAAWFGDDRVAPTREAIQDTEALVRKIGMEDFPERPIIGLDADGAFSILLRTDDFIADMSVFGDGTYSYFAKAPEGIASADAAKITGPLPIDLRLILPVSPA